MVRSDANALSCVLDQVAPPLESRHTIDEVLRWFEDNDIDFLQGVPPIRFGEQFDPAAQLFGTVPAGSRLSHLLTQLKWIFTIGGEGALCDMVGRKRGGEE